jgi:hypothetical protein
MSIRTRSSGCAKAASFDAVPELRLVASDSFVEFLREQLAPLGRVTMRRMFGKTGVFCDGMMFGMVTENTLYLRVDDGNRAAFKEAEAFPPLNYEKQGEFYRSLVLAGAGAAVRRTGRTRRRGAAGPRGGAPGRSENETNGAEAKICAEAQRMIGLSGPGASRPLCGVEEGGRDGRGPRP